MQVIPFKQHNAINSQSAERAKKPSFTGFLRHDSVYKCTLDSAFFRENNVLQSVITNLEKNFPKGAEILDFACSNGEEALSLLAQLKDKSKYSIKAFDVSGTALAYAKEGIHSVFSGFFDTFLLDKYLFGAKRQLKNAFFSLMNPAPKPGFMINDSSAYKKLSYNNPCFKEKYFKVKPEYEHSILFNRGDIRWLDKIETEKPVGAILFRNAFYHLCDNDIFLALNVKFRHLCRSNTEKIAKNVVDKVYDKLEKGGVFAIGEHFKDNVFLAGKFTPDLNKIPFGKCNFYSNEYAGAYNVKFAKKSPLVAELERDGRFEPIHYSSVEFLGKYFNCPTVWQKVK